MLTPDDRVFRHEMTGELRVVDHSSTPEFVGPPEGFVELVPKSPDATRRQKAIDSHVSAATSRLHRSDGVSMEDGHAQLLATQAIADALLALVHAVRDGGR
ncbi:hypothetical protein [Gordonia jacobaea]|uniref:hypothetical protein n=1 Tax=Gordonia jacobaea TaxID=122202 RepID=UPI0022E95F0F|nr:hypothetical protein [Gordonia jacobaea]